MKKKISISGMSCEHCVKHVTKALQELSDVSKVEVNLAGKHAIIESDVDITDEAIKAAIDDAGYEVTAIEIL